MFVLPGVNVKASVPLVVTVASSHRLLFSLLPHELGNSIPPVPGPLTSNTISESPQTTTEVVQSLCAIAETD